jgi:hypothetical protein
MAVKRRIERGEGGCICMYLYTTDGTKKVGVCCVPRKLGTLESWAVHERGERFAVGVIEFGQAFQRIERGKVSLDECVYGSVGGRYARAVRCRR